MGIRDDIQTELAAALNNADELGDISRDFDYIDPITNVATTGRGWRSKQNHFELNSESSQVYDLVFKCLTNELAVEPEIDGQLQIVGDPITYIIKQVKTTSSDTTWTMYADG